MSTTAEAVDYLALAMRAMYAGICVIPIGNDKRPLFSALPVDPDTGKPTWKPYQTAMPVEDEIQLWSEAQGLCGWAAVGGVVSGGLEVLDFDEEGFYEAWLKEAGTAAEGLNVQRTGGGTYQVWYRCDAPDGNSELAWIPDEAKDSGRRIAIESRGRGGYAVIPWSLHPSGNRYVAITPDFFNVPKITMERRAELWRAARSLDQCPQTRQQQEKAKRATIKPRPTVNGQTSVIDSFNKAVPIRAMLERAGYSRFGERFTRPGNDASPGGVVVFDDARSFHHSSNDPLHDGHAHDSFSIFTELKHNGDVSAAVKAAARELGIEYEAHEREDAAPIPTAASARQLMAEHPRLREPVIEGILRLGETLNLIAPSKTGKSWLVNDLGLALATGRPWLGRFAVHRGDVLILDNELHRETTANRLPRVADARGIPSEEWIDHLYVDNLRGRLANILCMRPYFKAIKPGRFKVVVLDALYRFMPRDSDENDNGTITGIYNALDDYAAMLGCSFVLIHHSSKGLQSDKSVTDVGAGAGAQSRAADAHLILRPHEEEDAVVLDAAVRSWPPIDPVCLRWSFPLWHLAEELDPTQLRQPRQKKRREQPGEPKAEPWTVERFVREFIAEKPQTQAVIFGRAGLADLSDRKAKQLLALAEAEGRTHRWSYEGRTAYFATIPQPVTETTKRD